MKTVVVAITEGIIVNCFDLMEGPLSAIVLCPLYVFESMEKVKRQKENA